MAAHTSTPTMTERQEGLVLIAAAILRASGKSLEAAASEAATLEILVRRGPLEVDDDVAF